MFDIGFFELLLIGIVGLLVLGPERLPKAARTAGLWVGRIKRTVSTMQREITSQLEAEELRQKLAEQQKKLDEGVDRAKRDVEETVGGIRGDTSSRSTSASAQRDANGKPPAEASSASTDGTDSSADTSSTADKDSASR
ncbi:Sec-independent protein translocase protein TatB [Salinicola rhizosphaerae]|uniref:Sec-independent protein translocase protein TatB n=1 Tax=Salinicola rhizosphaerae TaxID=1443141 RepID=A0ABQ3DY99_9GAMM|nr:Sec-independent protein translocase protein TatB [Salinicola rhizosphaerae]GHB20310.1 hypothetical protein GCM10009038_18790 [Salinicola rhizosphaerae]